MDESIVAHMLKIRGNRTKITDTRKRPQFICKLGCISLLRFYYIFRDSVFSAQFTFPYTTNAFVALQAILGLFSTVYCQPITIDLCSQ